MQWSVPVIVVALAAAGSTAVIAGGGEGCKESVAQTATHMKNHGWLGIETDRDEASGSYVITEVVAGGPAAQAGFRTGDVLVSMNGVRMNAENKAALKAAKKSLKPGSQVTYTVARGGRETQLTATLAEVPREVLARWVGEHVLDYHSNEAIAQAND